MHRKIFLLLVLVGKVSFSQDLDFNVIINAQYSSEANNPIYQTLERSLNEFVNQTPWSQRGIQSHERIKGSLYVTIVSREENTFSGSIEVRASRPVYGSSMQSPIFSIRDENFTFDYIEHEILQYNPSVFHSNLVSVVSFYVYTLLGIDADSFESMGGSAFYQQANQIVNSAQGANYPGWSATTSQSRFDLNAGLLSNTYSGYRQGLYLYHRKGLDLMHDSLVKGKQGVRDAILKLGSLDQGRVGAMLVRMFFDAKAQEIYQIFSGGPDVELEGMYTGLNKMAPTYSELWRSLPR